MTPTAWTDQPSTTRDIAIRLCKIEGGDPYLLLSCGAPEWAGFIRHAKAAQEVLVAAGLASADEIERGKRSEPPRPPVPRASNPSEPEFCEWRPLIRLGDFLIAGAAVALAIGAVFWAILVWRPL